MNWLKWISETFSKSPTKTKRVKIPKQSQHSKQWKPTPAVSKLVKLGVIVGHNDRQRGAQGIGIDQEFYYNSEVAQLISELCFGTIVDVKVFYRKDPVGGYATEIETVYDETDEWGADYTVELHYNASGPTAHGCETLHSTTVNSRRWAAVVHRHMVKAMGNKDRGLKQRVRNGKRGWLSMYAGNAPACLIEPAFGSNKRDADLLRYKQQEIAKAIVDAAIEQAS